MKHFGQQKNRKWLLIGIMVLFIVIGGSIYIHIRLHPQCDNVFEEIYYDKVTGWKMHDRVEVFTVNHDLYRFHLFPRYVPWTSSEHDIQMCRTNVELEKSGNISILYYKELRRIDFVYEYKLSNDAGEYRDCVLVYSYDLDTKTLFVGGNDQGEVEAFLYDIILPAWFSNNEDSSKFSMENLGDYIDAGRTLPKEEWTKYHYDKYEGEWNPASP